MSRTIAGPSRASGEGGRKVRTPLREWTLADLKIGHYTSEEKPAAFGCGVRASRLVTPGDQPRRLCCKAEFHVSACGAGFNPVRCGCVTDSATENKPPAKQPGDSQEENLRDIFQRFVSPVRVKRWGKSPPPRWQHRGHGKPREVQDQIGGQSWPGSLSTTRKRSGSSPFGASRWD